jgi:hypothetical protein
LLESTRDIYAPKTVLKNIQEKQGEFAIFHIPIYDYLSLIFNFFFSTLLFPISVHRLSLRIAWFLHIYEQFREIPPLDPKNIYQLSVISRDGLCWAIETPIAVVLRLRIEVISVYLTLFTIKVYICRL